MEIFLVELMRLDHVRIVLAGCNLPEPYGSYERYCQSWRLTPVENVEKYVEYCRQKNILLEENLIRNFAYVTDYIPGRFVSLVEPKYAGQRVFL